MNTLHGTNKKKTRRTKVDVGLAVAMQPNPRLTVKNATTIEQGRGESTITLDKLLKPVHLAVLFSRELIIEIVFSKCQGGHQASTA